MAVANMAFNLIQLELGLHFTIKLHSPVNAKLCYEGILSLVFLLNCFRLIIFPNDIALYVCKLVDVMRCTFGNQLYCL